MAVSGIRLESDSRARGRSHTPPDDFPDLGSSSVGGNSASDGVGRHSRAREPGATCSSGSQSARGAGAARLSSSDGVARSERRKSSSHEKSSSANSTQGSNSGSGAGGSKAGGALDRSGVGSSDTDTALDAGALGVGELSGRVFALERSQRRGAGRTRRPGEETLSPVTSADVASGSSGVEPAELPGIPEASKKAEKKAAEGGQTVEDASRGTSSTGAADRVSVRLRVDGADGHTHVVVTPSGGDLATPSNLVLGGATPEDEESRPRPRRRSVGSQEGSLGSVVRTRGTPSSNNSLRRRDGDTVSTVSTIGMVAGAGTTTHTPTAGVSGIYAPHVVGGSVLGSSTFFSDPAGASTRSGVVEVRSQVRMD